MRRRRLLGLIAAGSAAIAGCTTGGEPGEPADGTGPGTDTDSGDDGTPERPGTDDGPTGTVSPTDTEGGTPEPTPLSAACPTTQGLDVEWPTDLDAATVESFVESYERVYYREVVVEYEPESDLDSYELSGGVMERPRERGDGWVLTYSGSGGVYRPTLSLSATTADAPEDADAVPAEEIDDDLLAELVAEAAETGEADTLVEPPGERVDEYVDLLASLSDDFERLSGKGDSDELYVDVDGTTVELSATATNFHGDYWWDARYYVDDRVVRRTENAETDPQDGELLECRDPG